VIEPSVLVVEDDHRLRSLILRGLREAGFRAEGVIQASELLERLPHVNPDVLVIPLPGHTPGHCGIAVRTAGQWLLHAGDSYFFHGQIQTPPLPPPVALGFFQRKTDTNQAQRMANQERLRALNASHGTEITIFNSHDPQEYDGCCAHGRAGPTPA